MTPTFFDTNVLVYLFDADAAAKQARARELFAEAANNGEFLISTQVLQEFYVVTTTKLAVPLCTDDAEQAIRDLLAFPLVQIDGEMLLSAIRIQRRYGFSFWDSLIVQAALRGGARRLYTEDLQDGQVIDEMEIVNPFAD